VPKVDTESDRPSLPTRIALVGVRGSGKTCTGRHLAQLLGWQFIDADVVLEQRMGQSIQDLFTSAGEAAFRAAESRILAELCLMSRVVIATGGGVVMHPDNRALLQRSAWVAWLTADPVTLRQRLLQDAATTRRRPSLTGGGSATSLEEIESVLRVRQTLYHGCAHASFSTTDATPEQVARAILQNETWSSAPSDHTVTPTG
jgi:shikimate kinase